MYLYLKQRYEAKYQLLIGKRKSKGIKYLNDSTTFIEYSINMNDIYKNIKECNPNKNRKILIVFDDVILHILSNKKISPIVTELFVTGRKLISCFLLHNLILLFQKILD